MPTWKELLDTSDVAQMLGTTPNAVRCLRHTGGLPPAAKVGRRLLWRRADIDDWLAAKVDADRPGLTPGQRGENS